MASVLTTASDLSGLTSVSHAAHDQAVESLFEVVHAVTPVSGYFAKVFLYGGFSDHGLDESLQSYRTIDVDINDILVLFVALAFSVWFFKHSIPYFINYDEGNRNKINLFNDDSILAQLKVVLSQIICFEGLFIAQAFFPELDNDSKQGRVTDSVMQTEVSLVSFIKLMRFLAYIIIPMYYFFRSKMTRPNGDS